MATYTFASIDVQSGTKLRSLDNAMSSTASSFSYRSEQIMLLIVCSSDGPFRHNRGTQQGLRGIYQSELHVMEHSLYRSMAWVC